MRAANPAADAFLNVADVVARKAQIPLHEWVRYHLGWWTTVSESWLPPGPLLIVFTPRRSRTGSTWCWALMDRSTTTPQRWSLCRWMTPARSGGGRVGTSRSRCAGLAGADP